MYTTYLDSPLGILQLVCEDDAVTELNFLDENHSAVSQPAPAGHTPAERVLTEHSSIGQASDGHTSTPLPQPSAPLQTTVYKAEPASYSSAPERAAASEAARQLEEYFAGQRKQFTVKCRPAGTPFQQKVWQALRQIPYGTTCSYGEIAAKIGSPNACRAVGGANRSNPIPIIIPCHRVIGKNGTLTGFSAGIDKKILLLELEGVLLSSQLPR